jgi:hypothetical protein
MKNLAVQNEKPRVKGGASTQGEGVEERTFNNSTNSNPQKQRWSRGQELYKSGAVTIGKDGYFHVSGYRVDEQKVTCECPDYQERKHPCKHFYAVKAYMKHGKPNQVSSGGSLINDNGKPSPSQKVDEGTVTPKLEEASSSQKTPTAKLQEGFNKSENTPQNAPNKPLESPSKDFDKQRVITYRLAVINSAVEMLKTHPSPIEPEEVIFVASCLEKWALGG